MENGFASQLLVVFLLIQLLSSSAATTTQSTLEYIKASCSNTTYPKLCYTALSMYATNINTNPKLLAKTALNITLISTKLVSETINKVSRMNGLRPREAAIIADCVDVVGDSVYELSRSIEEMESNKLVFEMVISDIQTWVSAALTDDDTCMDGFEEKEAIDWNVKKLVRQQILRVSQLTSIALALVNCYALSQPSSP